jgi:hypothetical protein
VKNTIFLSHANPENNYFTAWLASKLKLLGYKVWADVNNIGPGQYFNQDFEKAIREDAIRFLAVVSSDYISKANRTDTGVMNEILIARTIKDVPDFIIPLRYDDSNYNLFPPGLIGRSAINFANNWATGLEELVKCLEESAVPIFDLKQNVTRFWYDAQKIKAYPITKSERYFTNWFETYLPERIYVHRPALFNDKDFSFMPYTFIRESSFIITFCSPETISKYCPLSESFSFSIKEFHSQESLRVADNFQIVDPAKKLVKLLNKTLRSFFITNGLKIYRQSNKKEVFIFPFNQENKKMISLKKFNKSRRSIIGTASDYTWYFGISHAFTFIPFTNFKLFYHLVFTDNRGIFLKPDLQHELRRSVPSSWYNREWFEKLLAFVHKLSKYDGHNLIKISVDVSQEVVINVLPLEFTATVGYNEPSDEPEH